jgi:hypothetical protein
MIRIGPNQKGWKAVKSFDVTDQATVYLNAMSTLAAEAGEKIPNVAWSYEVRGEGDGGKLTLYKREQAAPGVPVVSRAELARRLRPTPKKAAGTPPARQKPKPR